MGTGHRIRFCRGCSNAVTLAATEKHRALGAVFFWLTWHSGGLEAAIGLHAASNLLAFAQSLLTGTTLSNLFSSEVDWRLALVQLLASAAIAVLLVRLQGRHRKAAP